MGRVTLAAVVSQVPNPAKAGGETWHLYHVPSISDFFSGSAGLRNPTCSLRISLARGIVKNLRLLTYFLTLT